MAENTDPKKKKKLLLIVIILAAVGLVAYLLLNDTPAEQTDAAAAPGAGGAGLPTGGASGGGGATNSLLDLIPGIKPAEGGTGNVNADNALAALLPTDTLTGFYETGRINLPNFGWVKIYGADLSKPMVHDLYIIENTGERVIAGSAKFNELQNAIAAAGKPAFGRNS